MSKAASKKTVKAAPRVRAPKAGTQLPWIETLKAIVVNPSITEFHAGDKIVVKSKIKEGDKERIQAFEGVVIARNGRGIQETFTVRKVSAGVGVERVFPLHSPMIAGIDVKVAGFVRRAKLYYLRGLEGKKARIRDKNLKLAEAQGVTVEADVGAVAELSSEASGEAKAAT